MSGNNWVKCWKDTCSSLLSPLWCQLSVSYKEYQHSLHLARCSAISFLHNDPFGKSLLKNWFHDLTQNKILRLNFRCLPGPHCLSTIERMEYRFSGRQTRLSYSTHFTCYRVLWGIQKEAFKFSSITSRPCRIVFLRTFFLNWFLRINGLHLDPSHACTSQESGLLIRAELKKIFLPFPFLLPILLLLPHLPR